VGKRQKKRKKEQKITENCTKKVLQTLKGKRFSFQFLFLIKNPQLRGIPALRVTLLFVLIVLVVCDCSVNHSVQTFIFQRIDEDDDDDDNDTVHSSKAQWFL
jgi:hypothetical protein